MPPLDLPLPVEATLRTFFTCEFTTLTRSGQPVTWPTVPYYDPAAGTIVVTASVAFPVKALNARRDPRVALLYSDPTGSESEDAPAVLVQGDASVSEALELTPQGLELFKLSVRRQPQSRGFVANPIARRLFAFYFQRLTISVQPRRLWVWPHRDFGAPAQVVDLAPLASVPARQLEAGANGSARPSWDPRLAARARLYGSAVLTAIDRTTGYPASLRCAPVLDDARQVVDLPGLSPVAMGWQGRACLLFHRHNQILEDQHQLVVLGELGVERDTLALHPSAFVTANGRRDTDRMPHAGAPLHLLQFMLLGQRKARAYLARRGAPWPPIRFDRLLQALQE